jgi:threonine dehydratase
MDEGAITLPLVMACVDRVVHCTEDEIAAALRAMAWNEHMLVEGAAALALAGFRQIEHEVRGGVAVVVQCGANFDRTKVMGVLAA